MHPLWKSGGTPAQVLHKNLVHTLNAYYQNNVNNCPPAQALRIKTYFTPSMPTTEIM